jgi:hypothetical protein
MLQMRNGDKVPDEEQITELAMESASLAELLAEACEAFLRMCIEINCRKVTPRDELMDRGMTISKLS